MTTPSHNCLNNNPEPECARVVGNNGNWSVYLQNHQQEWPLVIASGLRVFRHFESVVEQLKQRGIQQFSVEILSDAVQEKEVIIKNPRPRVLKQAPIAAAYDHWFRMQIDQCLALQKTPLNNEDANAKMAQFKHSIHQETQHP
jgi:hypothetical protein